MSQKQPFFGQKMPISPNLHASWYLCEDITSEPPLGLNHIPMHRRARICSCSGYNRCSHQPIKTESRILTSNSSSSKKKKEVLARHDCSSSRPAAPLLNAILMQNRGRSKRAPPGQRSTMPEGSRARSVYCPPLLKMLTGGVRSHSPWVDTERSWPEHFLEEGNYSLIYSPMSGFTS